MHRVVRLLCGSIAALAVSSGVARPLHAAEPTAAGNDKAAIEALEKSFEAAFRSKDVDAVMKVYEPGAHLFVFDVTPPRQHVGWEDYKKDWQALFATIPGPVSFTITDLDITAVGSVAYGHSIQSLQYTGKDGARVSLTVRVSDVYRRIRGQWLIVQEHVSVPVDLATGKADVLSKP
jgi:ketosteroid isomerase-like protein